MNIRKLIIIQVVFLCLSAVVAHADGSWTDTSERWFEFTHSNHYSSYSHRVINSINWSDGSVSFSWIPDSERAWAEVSSVTAIAYFCSSSGVKQDANSTYNIELLATEADQYAIDYPSRECQATCPDNEKRDDITGECPNSCTALNGTLVGDGKVDVDGRAVTTFCANNGCEATGTPDPSMISNNYGGSWVSYLNDARYTGNTCTVSEIPSVVTPTPDAVDPDDPDAADDDNPYDDFCDEMQKSCNSRCANGSQMFSCSTTDGDYDCGCNNPLFPSDPVETPEVPTPETPETAPATATPSETAIVNNQGKQIAQGNTLIGLTKSNGENLEAIAKNTGELVKGINDGQLKKVISEGISDGIEDGIKEGVSKGVGAMAGDVADIEEGLKEGVYVPEALPEAITAPSEFDFSTRTGQFFTDMADTSLFGIVDDLGELSGSGSSAITIDGGDTFGTHTIDFSAFDEGLIALKYVFHLMGMIIGLRILTLKR